LIIVQQPLRGKVCAQKAKAIQDDEEEDGEGRNTVVMESYLRRLGRIGRKTFLPLPYEIRAKIWRRIQ
jgi:hypothetical protein